MKQSVLFMKDIFVVYLDNTSERRMDLQNFLHGAKSLRI